MTQQLLKNIYDAFGSLEFRYKGRLMYVSLNAETGEYELLVVNATSNKLP